MLGAQPFRPTELRHASHESASIHPAEWNSVIERPFAKNGSLKWPRTQKRKLFVENTPKQTRRNCGAHSKAKTPIAAIMKLTKRTEGSLRQKALKLGIGLGHQR